MTRMLSIDKGRLIAIGTVAIVISAVVGIALGGAPGEMVWPAAPALVFYAVGTGVANATYSFHEPIPLGTLLISVAATTAACLHVLGRPHLVEGEGPFAALPALWGGLPLSAEAAETWDAISWLAWPVMLACFGVQMFYVRRDDRRRRIHERWGSDERDHQAT